jgi:hypothetical protein
VKPVKNLGMVPGSFWALLRKPDALPVLFGSRQDAVENLDYDEYLVEVRVHPASTMALLRGRQELLRRREAERKAKARPRLPPEAKRRRGSRLTLVDTGLLRKALRDVAPKLKKAVAQAVKKEAKRAASPRVRR